MRYLTEAKSYFRVCCKGYKVRCMHHHILP